MDKKPDSKRIYSQDQSPHFRARAFRCPHCKAFAHQNWFALAASGVTVPPLQLTKGNIDLLSLSGASFEYTVSPKKTVFINEEEMKIINSRGALLKAQPIMGANSHHVVNCYISECASCSQIAIWISESMCFPLVNSDIPEPNTDIPDDIQKDYIEAAAIFHISPRGSAALLRLCIEKLCIFILSEKSDINDMIGKLVSKGLDKRIKEALDSVRVIGNEAIHPGELNIDDDKQTVYHLFGLVNVIADRLITQERVIGEVYKKIPPRKIAGIEARDKRTNKTEL